MSRNSLGNKPVKYRFFISECCGTYTIPKKIAKEFLKDRAEKEPDLILHELKMVTSQSAT